MSDFLSFGELMLRLRTPGYERFFQSPQFEATFGGGEANVAVSLSNYGFDAAFISALPDNDIGQNAVNSLRGLGVNTEFIQRQGDRVGIYFLETGANQRPSKVIYDRAHSSISQCKPGDFDWANIFKGAKWLHITGITPALSQTCADLSLECVQQAQKAGVTVSCDFNFRGKLWNYGKTAPEVMRDLVQYVDVGIANEEDCQKSLGISVDVDVESGSGHLDTSKYEELSSKVLDIYPGMHTLAITLRAAVNANINGWQACMRTREGGGRDGGFLLSKQYELTDIVDRVGGGDSFASAFIAGLNLYDHPQDSLEFAVAGSALKHSILGDYNRVSRAEVENLMQGDGSGRVQR